MVESALREIATSRNAVVQKFKEGYVIASQNASSHQLAVVNYHVAWFPAGHETLASASARLSGFILIGTEGASGFASDTLDSPESIRLSIPELRDVSFAQAALTVASLGPGAVWVLSQTPGNQDGQIGSANLEMFQAQDIKALGHGSLCSFLHR